MDIIGMSSLLREMSKVGASDLHLAAGSQPRFRVDGDLTPLGDTQLSAEDVKQLIYGIMRPEQAKKLEEEGALDFTHAISGVGRFRINVHLQRGTVAAAIRAIPPSVKSLKELHLPQILRQIALQPKGLVLVTGPTGSGKSTTLASMINIVNSEKKVHIISIEDPIEYVHPHKKAMVEQIEVGSDTPSFASALKYALRQDPDVILVGEMRDLETIAMAITAAETGHLVFATLHTPDAPQTISRIIDVFPADQQTQIRTQLSLVLTNVISQQLLTKKGGGRIPAYEILKVNHAVANLVRQNKIEQLYTVIDTGASQGMISLRSSLQRLVEENQVFWDDALVHSERHRKELQEWFDKRGWTRKSSRLKQKKGSDLDI